MHSIAMGFSLSEEDAAAFLNQHGRAYAMWKQMMHAGKKYLKGALVEKNTPVGLRATATCSRLMA